MNEWYKYVTFGEWLKRDSNERPAGAFPHPTRPGMLVPVKPDYEAALGAAQDRHDLILKDRIVLAVDAAFGIGGDK